MGVSKFSLRKNNNVYLYTKGREFSLDGNNYIGEYHFEGGTAKTGPVKSDDSKVLRRYYNVQDHYLYDKSFKFNVKVLSYLDPVPYLYKPREQVYISGYDSRYFVEKVDDENSYAIEIDQVQYQGLGKPGGIDGGLYLGAIVNWRFTGIREEVIKHNQREIDKASIKLPSVAYAVRSLLEFTRVISV